MKFQPGDLVEVVSNEGLIDPRARVRPGMRGTLIQFAGMVCPEPNGVLGGPWWEWECDGTRIVSHERGIRKVPPDPGRELVRWDQVDWKPSRSLVEA